MHDHSGQNNKAIRSTQASLVLDVSRCDQSNLTAPASPRLVRSSELRNKSGPLGLGYDSEKQTLQRLVRYPPVLPYQR